MRETLVEDLVARMTLEEKVHQLVYVNCVRDRHEDLIRAGLGVVANVFEADEVERLQRIATDETRLGIPLLFGSDVIHGFRTIFPICLGEACSWDLGLIERTSRLGAEEAYSEGIRWVYGPMLDVARDPRWGRICEGAGEDTLLASLIGAARVRGIQSARALACPKHFVAYGAGEGGRDYNTVDISEMTLREVYLPPFRAAIDAGAGSIMVAFNELNGVPVTADRRLLTDMLRGKWGFDGIIATDYNAIRELIAHGVATDERHACRIAVEAGIDMDMNSGLFLGHLASLVREGTIPEERLDESVRRMLGAKVALGLLGQTASGPGTHAASTRRARTSAATAGSSPDAAVGSLPGASPAAESSPEAALQQSLREAAFEAAVKSMVLLENHNAVLPLEESGGPIAVVGPLADDRRALLGWWRCNGRVEDTVTILDGIRSVVAGSRSVRYARGCDVAGDDRSKLDEAVATARESEVVVAVVGESAEMVGEAHSRSSLALPGVQEDLIHALVGAGKPIILVLVNGRPLAIEGVSSGLQAILEAWMPGTYGGEAVARVLFGRECPTGKLTTSFPRRTGQVPVYYNHKNTGRPPTTAPRETGEADVSAGDTARYLDVAPTPAYPFGFGLSYTEFEYRDLRLDRRHLPVTEALSASVVVKNTGCRAADEIVQLYTRRKAASVTRPVAELAGFARVHLEGGEETRVTFRIDASRFAFVNRDLESAVEPGVVEVRIGPDSTRGPSASVTLCEAVPPSAP